MALFSKKSSSQPARRQTDVSDKHRATAAELDERYAFRRNHTITGSASSRVQALSESSAHLKSSRVHAHSLTTLRRKLLLIFIGVILVATLLYGLVSQLTGKVAVQAAPTGIALDTSYQKAIESYLSKAPLERLRFVLDEPALTRAVQQQLPEVRQVTAAPGKALGESLFTVTLRQPVVGWTMNGEQQYVDDTGVAFRRNYFTPPTVQVVDQTGIPTSPGAAVASNRFLGFIGRLIGAVKSNGHSVTQVVIPPATSRQVELHLENVPSGIVLSVDRSVGEQVEDMNQALNWFATKGQSPQYIDLRVSGKAYYR